MACHPIHFDTQLDPLHLRPVPWRIAATGSQQPSACDDDDCDDEDWDGCEGDPRTDPIWDPLGLDDEDEPQPEYGDFWDEPDEFED